MRVSEGRQISFHIFYDSSLPDVLSLKSLAHKGLFINDVITGGGGGHKPKDDKRSLAFKDHFQPSIITPPFFLEGGSNKKNTLYVWFYVPKERIVTLMVVTGCEGPSTMVRNPTYAVLSRKQVCRELHAR